MTPSVTLYGLPSITFVMSSITMVRTPVGIGVMLAGVRRCANLIASVSEIRKIRKMTTRVQHHPKSAKFESSEDWDIEVYKEGRIVWNLRLWKLNQTLKFRRLGNLIYNTSSTTITIIIILPLPFLRLLLLIPSLMLLTLTSLPLYSLLLRSFTLVPHPSLLSLLRLLFLLKLLLSLLLLSLMLLLSLLL